MKQTKPFGQAYIPSAVEAAAATRKQEAEPEPAVELASEAKSSSTATASRASAPAPQTPKQSYLIRNVLLVLVLVPLLLCCYVLMRDSMRAMGAVDPTSSQDSVMYCKVGSISYEGMDIMDRIMGNGAFVCSDWHTGSRFITLPKGPHFVEQ